MEYLSTLKEFEKEIIDTIESLDETEDKKIEYLAAAGYYIRVIEDSHKNIEDAQHRLEDIVNELIKKMEE